MSDINPPSTPSINAGFDWADNDRRHAALAEAVRPANKAALFDVLASTGITSVIVQFDGSCDSGQIESIQAKKGDALADLPDGRIEIARTRWGSAEIARLSLSVREAVEQLAYDFLEEAHGGWENNDGAWGEFTFDVGERTVTLDYNQRITDSDYSQHVF